MRVGQRVRQLRKDRDVSLVELARQVNISQPYLSQIELDQKQPSLTIVKKICQSLGISLSDFFKEESGTNLGRLMAVAQKLTPEELHKLEELIITFKKEQFKL